MFDSPFAFCPVCREAVLLDQTHSECRSEHGCTVKRCPMLNGFTGHDFRSETAAPATPPRVGRAGRGGGAR